MMQGDNTLLLNALQELRDGQRAIVEKLDTAVGEQAQMRERLAMLEAGQGRYITYKQMVVWMLGGASLAGTATTVLHALVRGFGG